uniref:Phage integrase, N-terminal SAM-like domain n=1 Tax=Candidatus Kentrum sp. LFY TaxID=2126342 RepID=A0A450V665_9GAMM|nr:MAG: Phage integrase, N-terminal SAM-like domain [Candidatus Kentron sp. LFY]
MTSVSGGKFNHDYRTHLEHPRLEGLQPKTIEAHARAIRRIGAYFHCRIDDLSGGQLTDYFIDLLDSYSWSAVEQDLWPEVLLRSCTA